MNVIVVALVGAVSALLTALVSGVFALKAGRNTNRIEDRKVDIDEFEAVKAGLGELIDRQSVAIERLEHEVETCEADKSRLRERVDEQGEVIRLQGEAITDLTRQVEELRRA